jgi:ubiquinol-cytochrome c reductase cytochrome b subunit
MKSLLAWLENRTGIGGLIHEALYERIPGGPRWRYVWGSTLVFAFVTQVITGTALCMAYAPSAQTAWESVFYIQHQMEGGWLLRGIHHFTAQAMVVLLVIHLWQVIIDGAYRAPREFNYWLGLILMKIVLGLALTGYLLPWDQKGYWATRVATNLMGLIPVVGERMQQLVVGGSDYGHHTLTRFFGLHVIVLPAVLVALLAAHVALFRKHGICPKEPLAGPAAFFWPRQVLIDSLVCLAVLAVVVGLAAAGGISKQGFDPQHAGAELTAPADPSQPYSAARPEWYFLFLFQLLKYFPGEKEIYGAIVVPMVVMLLLFLMPLVGRWKWGHRWNMFLTFAIIFLGVLPLTILAWYADHYGPDAATFTAAQADANEDAARAIELASSPAGIPPTGAISLMQGDPLTHGKRLFQQHCAACHGQARGARQNAETFSGAPSLRGFATQNWIAGLLDPKRVDSDEYFGNTKHHKGEMVDFVKGDLKNWPAKDVEAVIAALAEEAKFDDATKPGEVELQRIEAGRKLMADGDKGCAQCHRFHEHGDGRPDLTGYGSAEWLMEFIAEPSHARFYPGEENDRMPNFGKDKLLTDGEIAQIAEYLRHHSPARP